MTKPPEPVALLDTHVRRTVSRPWRRLLGWTLIIYFGVMLVAWFLLWRFGDVWWPGTLLLYGPRWLALLPLVLLIPLCFRYWKIGLIGCLLLGLFLAGPWLGGSIPWRRDSQELARMRLVSFNANQGRFHLDAWNAFLEQTSADIVVCQEWRAGDPRPPLWNSGWHVREDRGSLLLASKFPITHGDTLFETDLKIRGFLARYELSTPLGQLSLANLHLPTPRGEGELEEVLHGQLGKLSTLDELSKRRWQASRQAFAWLLEKQPPLVLAGDFNLPEDSRIYRDVWGIYQNAWKQAGWGYGFTKWTRWHGIRIDHVLLTTGWQCQKAWVGTDVGSDHLPLVTELIYDGGQP